MDATGIASTRWLRAQEYERKYWIAHKERILSDDWIQGKVKRAMGVQLWLSKFINLSNEERILQIGAGGEGEINFFTTGRCYAVDPLMPFYKEHFSKIINPDVDFRKAKGEQLPFDDNYFDGIIISNVLDHTDDPHLVLREIFRTLKPGGVAIIEVHVYWWLSYFVKQYFKKNIGHPHVFTLGTVTRRINRTGFRVRETRHSKNIEMYLGHWLKCLLLSRRVASFAVTK